MNYLDISTPLQDWPLQFKSIQFAAPGAGPRLLITGAVHGNETCGTRAILQVLQEFESGELKLSKGQVTFIPVTNPLAYQKRQRNGDRNLNRNLRPSEQINEFEDHIANWLCPIITQHEVLLDLHSFQSGSQPFAMMGPQNNDGPLEPFANAAHEEAMGLALGVHRFVDGWLSTYARGVQRRMSRAPAVLDRRKILSTDPNYGIGTTEYMRRQGGFAITLECGQHESPEAPHVAYRAIKNTLAHFGLVDLPKPQAVLNREALNLYDVIDKETAADSFAQPWASFDHISAGTTIGIRDGKPFVAEEACYIVFPNPKAEPGNEWFYLAKKSSRLSETA